MFENLNIYLDQCEHGTGVFAGKQFLKGERILVFTGPLISFEEAAGKGEKESWPLQIGSDTYLDLEPPGCYANHSCKPNSGIVDNIYLVALMDIAQDEEICYDYSTTVDEDYFRMKCQCGSDQCRHVIADFRYLDPVIKVRYLSMGIVQDFIAKQYGDLLPGD